MHPIYMVLADGADITATIMSRLLSLSVTDKAGLGSDTFELNLDDSDDTIDPPRKGAKLKIYMGYVETGMTYLGEFTVDEVEVALPPRELRITGKSADVREGAKSQKTRAFDDKPTLKKVFGQIAQDEKLTLKIDGALASKTVDYLAQTEESNLNLMTRLAAQFDAIAKISDGKLIVTKRGSAQSASGKAMPARTLILTDIIKVRGKLKDRERFGAVKAVWHDQGKAKKTEVKEQQGEGPVFTLRQTYPSEAEARDACKAKLAEMQRREAELSIEIEGDATLGAETKLTLATVSRKLDGEYIVKQARHTMKGTKPGFRSQLEAEPPGRAKAGKKS